MSFHTKDFQKNKLKIFKYCLQKDILLRWWSSTIDVLKKYELYLITIQTAVKEAIINRFNGLVILIRMQLRGHT